LKSPYGYSFTILKDTLYLILKVFYKKATKK